MTDINFTSSYRIPITQAGAKCGKKIKLKELAKAYPNNVTSKNNAGTVRVSMPNSEDANFVRKLRRIGYKVFQKFEGEDIPKHKLTGYIKDELNSGNYKQFGKQKKRLSKQAKAEKKANLQQKQLEKNLDNGIETEITQVIKPKNVSDRFDTNFKFEDFEIK